MITADARRQRGLASVAELDRIEASRAVQESMAVLDEAAFGATSETLREYVQPVDPAARRIAAASGPAVYAYCTVRAAGSTWITPSGAPERRLRR